MANFARPPQSHERASAEVPMSLGPGTPPFQAWRIDEMPAEWQATQRHPDTKYVAVEVPDTPWGRAYHDWFRFGGQFSPEHLGVFAAVMVVNMHDYNGGADQRAQAARVLRSLLEAGKPPPCFVRLPEEGASLKTIEFSVLHGTSRSC